MLKDKKMIFFLLAANSVLSASSYGENFSDSKYEKLYNNIIKNIETGKSNESNNKIIESILNKRNKELKDLYAQSDYIVKPEYLEWQIFASGFYAEKDRGYDSDKDGDGGSKKNSSQVTGTDLRTAKQVQIGATIPIKIVNDFKLEPEININKKEITVESIQAPTVVPKVAPVINIPNVNLPVINVTQPSAVLSPQVVSPDININTTVTIPQVQLSPITVVSFGLPFFNSTNSALSFVYNQASYLGTYTLGSGSTLESVLTLSNSTLSSSLTNNAGSVLTVQKPNTRVMEVDEPNSHTLSILNYGTLNLQANLTVGMEARGSSGFTSGSSTNVADHNTYAYNYGNIVGISDSAGNYKNQAALSIGMDGSVQGTKVLMENTATGTITMNAPESVGIQLRPDSNLIVQQGINEGVITINGRRSYGMMTTLGSGTGFLNQDPSLPNGTSALALRTAGIINVNGDESTGFAILVPINEWGGSGTINIGTVNPNQDPVNGNLHTSVNLVERATGLYSNQQSLTVSCSTGLCGNAEIMGTGSINVGSFAYQSSGVRAEGLGVIGNTGTINISGDNNYGAVITNQGLFNNHVWTLSSYIGKINVNSNNSIGAFVNEQGKLVNESLISVSGNNSIGLLQNNGVSQNLGSVNNPAAYGRGDATIETTGQNAHAVILTKANSSLTSSLYNTGIIKNNSEGTIGIYAEKGAAVSHLFESATDPLAQTAKIQSGNGAIGVYVKDSGTIANIGAPVITGDSTTKTSIAVMSDGNSTVNFENTGTGTNKQAKIKLGQNAIGLYSIDGTKFSNTFVINGLEAEIGNNSVLAYVTESNASISNLDNIKVKSMGTNSVFLYGANYSDIIIDSNITIPMAGGTVDPNSQVYVAENSKVTLNTGKVIDSNTKTGLSAFSQSGKKFRDGTVVIVDKSKTGVTNKGKVNMNSSSSVGLYTLYGKNLNDTTGEINIQATASSGVGMYSEEEADLENKGTINLKSANAVGMYGKGDSSAAYSSLDNINIINSGSINLNGNNNIGISADNNKAGATVADSVITNTASGSDKIFVNGTGSVGIYAPFSTVNQSGNIMLTGANTVGVYGTNGAIINSGGIIELNTANQSQIAYYLEGNTTKLRGSLGDIIGHGIAVLSDGAVLDNSMPTLDLTGSGFSDGGDGKIALVLQGATTFNYTNDIKVGNSVDVTSDGIPDHYAVALYTDNQNLSSGIANNLTAGANGVGIYAQNGSNIKYSGVIAVGDNTTAGTGVYIGTNSGIGSSITLDNATVNLKGTGGIGAYVDNLSTLTFEANSTMNFSGDGVGIYGVQGAIINDNGGVINSNGYAVERTRIQGGIININSNVNVSGGSILGHAVNGEISVMPGVTVTASGNDVIGIFGDGLRGAGSWTQNYEANNFGTIDFSGSDKATAIYLNNARGENKGIIKVNNDSIAFYGQGVGSEIYNNGFTEIGSNSVGLYGNDADIIENLSGAVIKDKGTTNTGIYNIKTTAGNTVINNGGTIELGNDGVGIYAENSTITNTGSITVGNKVSKNSLGIYAKNSTVSDSGNIKVGNSGIAYYGDNSTLNLNSASVDIANNGVLAYGINNTTINYNLGNKTTSENTFVYLINSNVDFNGAEITVSKNSLGVYQEGLSAIQGYNKLYIGEDAAGIFGYQTDLFNIGSIELTGKNSVGIIAEDSDVTNNSLKSIKSIDSGSVGIYSVLKTPSLLKKVVNNGTLDISGDKSIGIYGDTLNASGTSIGTTEIWNNDTIKMGSASTVNNAIIGIYGTEGVEINTAAGSNITGGNNVVGVYSNNGKIEHKGLIDVKDNSVGVYASGGTADIDSSSFISVGNNGAVALYVNEGGTLTNHSANIAVGSESIIGYSKDTGTLLDNTGNLSVGTESVGFYSSGGEIKNTGTLTSTGDGVILFYGNSGKITNSGVINGSANGYGVGIYGKNSEITNTNSINLGDSKIVNPLNPGDSNNRYAVGIYGDSSKIYNDGNINVGESGIGIYSYRQSSDLINDTNALITSNKDKSIGILAEIGSGRKVINNGEINLSGNESIGIAINNGVILENTGKVQVSGNDSIGIMATKDSVVYNSGIINASGNNTMAVLLRDNSKLVNTGTINLGSGTLGVINDSTSTVNGYTGTSLESSAVKIPSIANVPTYKPPTIINAGVIKVGAKFEVPYDGVVQVKVDPDTVRTPTAAEMATSDLAAKFLVSNAVKFVAPEFNINDVTITSDFTQGTSAKTYKLEDVFIPSEPGGGINSGIATILSQSYTWDATPVTNSKGNVDIWMQKIEYADLLEDNWNEDFGAALDGKYEDATGDALKIFNKIDRLENERDFKHVMSSLAGNIYANINQRENDIANIFENSMDLLESSENNTKENVKVNIIGGKGRTNEDTDGVVGYDYTTTGVLGLREVERTYKQTFGYSLGYLHTGFEFKDNNESEEWVDTVQIGLHNKYKSNDWKLRNDLTGRVSFHNVDRNLDWPSPNNRSEMNGTYETYSITSDNILGREFSLGKNSSITPYGALRAMYVMRPTFSESGLESLEVDGNDAWSVKPRAGIELETGIPLGAKSAWQLKGKLDVAYEYELANLNERERAKLIAIEDGYHNLAKPEEEKGKLKTRAAIGFEVNDRYGLFLNGEYSLGEHDQDEYRAGVTIKAVF
jgi:hypothetical protein